MPEERIPVPLGVLRQQIHSLSDVVSQRRVNGTPQELSDLGNLSGNLNASLAAFDGAVVTPPPLPPPTGGVLDRINRAPSQWAKNLLQTDAESAALIAAGRMTEADSHRLANWWSQNGVKGYHDPVADAYFYFTVDASGTEWKNRDDRDPSRPGFGFADRATEELCGQPIPGPLL